MSLPRETGYAPLPAPAPPTGRVLLISSVGFAAGWTPLGISLIKSYLKARGFDADTLSLCVGFSRFIAEHQPALASYDRQMGEWGSSFHELYFAAAYFRHAPARELIAGAVGDMVAGTDIYKAPPWDPRQPASAAMVDFHTDRILAFCALVETYSNEHLDRALVAAPAVVGLSAHAQQIFASAVLARRVRERVPGAAIVLGGPAVTSLTAHKLLRLFPEIDVVVFGDGEEAMHRITGAVLAGELPDGLPGVLVRGREASLPLRPAGAPPLDDIPAPDYGEIKEQIAAAGLPLTTWMGRGCSWGRCSFCAIPDFQRRLLNRSPRRVYDDLVQLSLDHGMRRFRFGDWEVNGDVAWLEQFCRLLIAGGHGFEFWAEVNARNLSSELVGLLKRAGFVSLQVGLEAFSTSLLRKMQKPASLFENVQCLRHAQEHGLEVFSNLLFNTPGEEPRDVEETLRNIRALRHLLKPPVRLEPLEFLLETDADAYRNADPAESAPCNFEARCFPADADGGVAYLRTWNRPANPRWIEVHRELSRCRDGAFSFVHADDGRHIRLLDARGEEPVSVELAGAAARIYRLLAAGRQSERRLLAAVGDLPAAVVMRHLEDFAAAGWILREGNICLGLSTAESVPAVIEKAIRA